MRSLLASIIVLATLAGPASADQARPAKVPRVGVVVGVTVNVPTAIAESISAGLAAALVKKLKVDAIGGAEVTRRLPETGVPEECLTTPACINDLARRLAADQLLYLAVVRVGGDYQVDVTFVDVATGAQAARPRVQVSDPTKAADQQFADQATLYLPDAEVRSSTNQTVVIHTEGERHRPIKKTVWILGGVGAAGLITASVVGLLAKSKYDACNDPLNACTDDKKAAIRTRTRIADVTLAVGVAAAITAVVLYAKTPVEILPVTPSVSPVNGGAVLSFDGQF